VGEGTRVVDTERYFATVVGGGRYVNASRLRFAPEEAAEVMAEVRALAPRGVGAWSTRSKELADALLAAGGRDPEPPIMPWCTALAIDAPPPGADGVEVRRVETLADFLVGLEIELASSDYTPDAKARRRSEAEQSYARRRTRPGGDWLAYVDGRAVASAAAMAGPRGLYLAGGSTLPDARGRGCYRALVRARWDYAVSLGTPALVVHAQETSRRILERCGFTRVCTIYELEHDP
jgi:GNAT superfamily N-acetyltransferase